MNILSTSSQGIDLLRIKPIRRLILWGGFPYVFQAIMLAIFIYLAIIGLDIRVPESVNGKLFAKTNLVNLTIWGLWWPMMIWMAVLFGRVWCMVCPMELVSNGMERLGRTLGVQQVQLNSWLRSGFLILFLYFIIQFMVAGFQIHRIPFYTSLFLWSMLILAAFTGLLFKDRAFCRGFCPVALLLSTYGRGGMLVVRAEGVDKCQGCTGKDCLKSCNRNRLDARSCPSLLNPPKLNSSRDCLVCGQCLKSCQPDNMKLYLRKPFHPADARESLASWTTTLFIMLASGFVTAELCAEWVIADGIFLRPPHVIAQNLGLESFTGWLKGLWMLLVYPAILWIFMGLLVKPFVESTSLFMIWRRIAIPFAVIVSAGHMTKAFAKFTSWVGFLPYAISEPSGSNTVLQITSKLVENPAPIVSAQFVSISGLSLLALGMTYAWKEMVYVENPTHRYYTIPMAAIALFWSFIIWGIGFGP